MIGNYETINRGSGKEEFITLLNHIAEISGSKVMWLDDVYEGHQYPEYALYYDVEDQQFTKMDTSDNYYEDKDYIGEYYFKKSRLPFLLRCTSNFIDRRLDSQKQIIESQDILDKILGILKED